jgi:hypothetical protein
MKPEGLLFLFRSALRVKWAAGGMYSHSSSGQTLVQMGTASSRRLAPALSPQSFKGLETVSRLRTTLLGA